jgi:hypothetical protein
MGAVKRCCDGLGLTDPGVSLPSTTTVLYKKAHLADNGGNTKPLEGQ